MTELRRMYSRNSGERIYGLSIPGSFDELMITVYDIGTKTPEDKSRENQEVAFQLNIAGNGIYTILELKEGGIRWAETLNQGGIPTSFGPAFFNQLNLLKLIEANTNEADPNDANLIRRIITFVKDSRS